MLTIAEAKGDMTAVARMTGKIQIHVAASLTMGYIAGMKYADMKTVFADHDVGESTLKQANQIAKVLSPIVQKWDMGNSYSPKTLRSAIVRHILSNKESVGSLTAWRERLVNVDSNESNDCQKILSDIRTLSQDARDIWNRLPDMCPKSRETAANHLAVAESPLPDPLPIRESDRKAAYQNLAADIRDARNMLLTLEESATPEPDQEQEQEQESESESESDQEPQTVNVPGGPGGPEIKADFFNMPAPVPSAAPDMAHILNMLRDSAPHMDQDQLGEAMQILIAEDARRKAENTDQADAA